MQYQIIKREDFIVHRWSGGTTSEIFLFPPSSCWEKKDFQIRISSADCRVDGAPYSDFTGFTRHILPLRGSMHMFHEGHHEVLLNPFDVDIFDGSWNTHHIGKAVDFNLLYSENWTGRLKPLLQNESIKIEKSGIIGFYAVEDAEILSRDFSVEVPAGDFIVFNDINEATVFSIKAALHGPCVIAAAAFPKGSSHMRLSSMPVDEFCALTASDAPAPGGGSVSALCGSLAVALAEMVGNLTLGRRGCEDAQESIREALAELEEIRTILLKAIDEDSESFNGFMTALKMPKNTEEEKALRKTAMSQALRTASLVPLKVAGQSVRIFKFSRLMLERGNKNAATDAMVSALAARTAAIGALLNVRINLRSIHDPEFVRTTLEEVLRLETLTNEQEKEITEIGYQLLNQ